MQKNLCLTGAAVLAAAAMNVYAQPTATFPDVATAAVVISGLVEPVSMTAVPGDDTRLLVVEKAGRVRLVNVITETSGSLRYELATTPALDIVSTTRSAGLRGLTGIALDPNFATSGYVYLFHNTVTNGLDRTAVDRYTRLPGPGLAFAPESRLPIWSAPAGEYHHGGTVKFGPDGMLYITKGDEGNQVFSARNPGSIYGKILRIDPRLDAYPADPTRNYGIPADNPYLTVSGSLPELWAVGMRSQWQFSFDRFNGDFYLADVGESAWEEISFVPANRLHQTKDFGWPNWEGASLPPWGVLQPVPNPATLIFPLYTYPHTLQPGYTPNQVGCAVTCGVVYRGSAIRSLRGRFLFAELCYGRVYSLVQVNGVATDFQDLTDILTDTGLPTQRYGFSSITNFAEDNQGEVFLVEYSGNRISKIVPHGTQPALADISGPGQSGGPDGQFTADDIITFLGWFFQLDPRADCAGPGQAPFVDQQVTADDIIRFLSAFFAER